jgi:hypothetical protein
MKQSPSWEADSHTAGESISRLLCNPKYHYRVDKSPPLIFTIQYVEEASSVCATSLHTAHCMK